MLHALIFNVHLTNDDISTRQQILVLVTGDGNPNSNQTSFPSVVEIILKRAWRVELWSWEQSLSRRYFDIQKHFATQLTIKYLDPYRKEITFEPKAKRN
jgi:hypothetical protein